GETLEEALPNLRAVYCDTLAYQIEHISNHEERVWLRQGLGGSGYRRPAGADEQRALLTRLSEVEGFERYLRRAFLGQKQFSIEGLDVMVPMLDEAIARASESGANAAVLGWAPPGRPPAGVSPREFEGERLIEAVTHDPEGGTGDVKYHYGSEGVRKTEHGDVRVQLASNPSHLE